MSKILFFSEPIVIDPSAFDNVHNVLDIIIASIYQKFSDKYDVSPERFDNYRREQLLNEFQKVYKDILCLMILPKCWKRNMIMREA